MTALELPDEQYDPLERAVFNALEVAGTDARWVHITQAIEPLVARLIADAERRGFDNGVGYVIGLMEPLLGDLPGGGCSDPQCADCATEWGRVDAPTVLLSRVDSTNPNRGVTE